jgi:hypothetical protein
MKKENEQGNKETDYEIFKKNQIKINWILLIIQLLQLVWLFIK